MKHCCLPLAMLALATALGGMKSPAAETPKGTKPSVTVFPVDTTLHKSPDESARRVGIVVATLLEQAGLEELEVAETRFSPPETDDVRQIAEAFGNYVAGKPIGTGYAVFSQLIGTPQTGVKEIRTIVVDKSGKVLLADSAEKSQLEKAPIRPKDPMTCCIFVSRRLQEFWNLEDPLRANPPRGKMARFWQEDAGIPGRDELDAIAKRSEVLKQNAKTAACTVYPVRVGQQSDRQVAADLASMLNEGRLCKAEASQTDPALKITGHSNEQKVLWDTARAFREFVRKNPPTTDYAVYADYGLSGAKVHHVHVIVCDRSGDWVLVDMQNSHHPDFERVDPKSAADCNRLLIERLKGWLSE